MPAQLLAMSLFDDGAVAEKGLAIGDEPRKPNQVCGCSSRSLECGEHIRERLAALLRKVVGDEFFRDRIASDLTGNRHQLSFTDDHIGIAAGIRPALRTHLLDRHWQEMLRKTDWTSLPHCKSRVVKGTKRLGNAYFSSILRRTLLRTCVVFKRFQGCFVPKSPKSSVLFWVCCRKMRQPLL